MKKIIILILLVLIAGCNNSHRYKAETALRSFIETIVDHPELTKEFAVDENALNDINKVTSNLSKNMELMYSDNLYDHYTFEAISPDDQIVFSFTFRVVDGKAQIFGVEVYRD